MSQHAEFIGRRGLRFSSTDLLSFSFSGAQQAHAIVRPAAFIGSSARHSITSAVSSFSRPSFERLPHTYAFFAQNASIRWSRPSASNTALLGLRRSFHTPTRVSEEISKIQCEWRSQRRWKSDRKTPPSKGTSQEKSKQPSVGPSDKAKERTAAAATGSAASGKTHLLDRLPHLHRPTKEELLAAATGFWHRLQIRFKWFSIRSVRPFTSEEIFAFMSWIFWGHVLWIVIGTTTFVSLAIWAVNTVFAQETLAEWVGLYLTKSVGVKIVFESAIVPRWRDGVICFQNVFVSRRPVKDRRERSVSKGKYATAAATAAQAEKEKGAHHPDLHSAQEDDGNYTQFDVAIDSVAVTLSFTKWFNGKGLLRDVEIHGVRGVLDRTSVQPIEGDEDPKSFRHEHNTGDFEIDSFKMEDVLLTVYQPKDFRPFQVSVFNCELPRLRKQWLFYDFLSATNMSGSFDDSLFTIHPRQAPSYSGGILPDGQEDEAAQWKKHSRLRIDGLQIDHLNRDVEGPFSWIYEGNVDIVADVMIPNDANGSIAKVMSDFYDRMEATVTNSHTQQVSNGSQETENINTIDNHSESVIDFHPQRVPSEEKAQDNQFVVFDIQIHLNDVRARVPIFTRDLSYGSNAVVRPIVAYINNHSHRDANFIPITCRIVKRLSEFDGSWTVFDSGLLDDLSRETYEAFVRDIMDRKQRRRRIKKVGLWAAQVAAQALFIGLAGQLA